MIDSVRNMARTTELPLAVYLVATNKARLVTAEANSEGLVTWVFDMDKTDMARAAAELMMGASAPISDVVEAMYKVKRFMYRATNRRAG